MITRYYTSIRVAQSGTVTVSDAGKDTGWQSLTCLLQEHKMVQTLRKTAWLFFSKTKYYLTI